MKTVLIIEDDTALRENTVELLQLSNYTVYAAPNGKIGIEMAKKYQPNVIICDIMMPVIDGYGVLEALADNHITSHIPFIFLTAKTEYNEIRKGMNLGADDYLTKPFEEEELINAIETRLSRSSLLLKHVTSEYKKNVETSTVKNLNELKNLFDDHGVIRSFAKDEFIYKEGTYSKYIYLILKGAVKNYKMESSGKELITTIHKADDFLGFTSFGENVPYQETATALELVEVAGITKLELKKILSDNKELSVEIVRYLSNSVLIIKEQLLHLAYSSVRKKTAQSILQFSKLGDVKSENSINISRGDLASAAGIATESLIRTLSEFKKRGLIEIHGRNIIITDAGALEKIE